VNRTKPVTSRGLRVTSCARAGRGKSQISSTKSQTSLNSPMTQTQDILHSAICNLQSAIVPSSVSRPQSSVFTLHSSLSRPQSPVSGLRSIVYGLQSKVSLPRSSFFVPGSSFFPLPPSSFLPHPSPSSSRRIHPSSSRLHLSPLCSALCHFHFPLRILAVLGNMGSGVPGFWLGICEVCEICGWSFVLRSSFFVLRSSFLVLRSSLFRLHPSSLILLLVLPDVFILHPSAFILPPSSFSSFFPTYSSFILPPSSFSSLLCPLPFPLSPSHLGGSIPVRFVSFVLSWLCIGIRPSTSTSTSTSHPLAVQFPSVSCLSCFRGSLPLRHFAISTFPFASWRFNSCPFRVLLSWPPIRVGLGGSLRKLAQRAEVNHE
jgi:hypothetical protein